MDILHRSARHQLDRRKFLMGLGACALHPPLSAGVPGGIGQRQVIDVHHHFLPPFYKPSVLPWLRSHGAVPPPVAQWTPETSLEALSRAGNARAILSISAPGTTQVEAYEAAELARKCNDFASELAAGHPETLQFFVTLPMPDVEASLRELDRALAMPGAVGVALLTSYSGKYLGDPQFERLFARLHELRAIAFVHPTVGSCCEGLTPAVPTALVEFPVDTGRAIATLLWSGSLSRFSDIRFIFSHGGGVLPMLTERLKLVGLTDPAAAARVPEGVDATLARLYVDIASATHPAAIAAASSQFGDGRLLFGTDYPWGSPAGTLATLNALELPSPTLEQVTHGNAADLLSRVGR